MSTPHNQASIGDIAKVVLMPGDPLRAKYIAETFLEDVVQFNSVRNMYGYTGTYNGKKVSVMGSGMGMGSIGIYSYELFNDYGVDTIIRIGSAGAYIEDLKIRDVVIGSAAYSDSNFCYCMTGEDKHLAYPSSEVCDALKNAADSLNFELKETVIHSSDVFYHTNNNYRLAVDENKCGCVEMESFVLFTNAQILGKKAATILTISDSFVSPEITTAEERQTTFTKMMSIALEAAVNL